MRKSLSGLLVLITAFVAAGLCWRWASRRRQLPCPSWLAWLLENPLTEAVAGTEPTLERIGLQPGEYVLDAGSGPGRLTLAAGQRVGPTGHVVALDVQLQMLARLQARLNQANIGNVTLHHADIANDPSLPLAAFDRAWLVTVLGEIPDREAALRNLWRVLKPGGTLSVTEILPDPHYQSRGTVLRLGRQSGFTPSLYWGTPLAFTQNFVKREG